MLGDNVYTACMGRNWWRKTSHRSLLLVNHCKWITCKCRLIDFRLSNPMQVQHVESPSASASTCIMDWNKSRKVSHRTRLGHGSRTRRRLNTKPLYSKGNPEGNTTPTPDFRTSSIGRSWTNIYISDDGLKGQHAGRIFQTTCILTPRARSVGLCYR
jgi:hypothetical protein